MTTEAVWTRAGPQTTVMSTPALGSSSLLVCHWRASQPCKMGLITTYRWETGAQRGGLKPGFVLLSLSLPLCCPLLLGSVPSWITYVTQYWLWAPLKCTLWANSLNLHSTLWEGPSGSTDSVSPSTDHQGPPPLLRLGTCVPTRELQWCTCCIQFRLSQWSSQQCHKELC